MPSLLFVLLHCALQMTDYVPRAPSFVENIKRIENLSHRRSYLLLLPKTQPASSHTATIWSNIAIPRSPRRATEQHTSIPSREWSGAASVGMVAQVAQAQACIDQQCGHVLLMALKPRVRPQLEHQVLKEAGLACQLKTARDRGCLGTV
ncbi:hypothetical protein DFH94DRAFT_202288 [Russula ochroleuca]|jgi:hypothetical protein|uniref:Uncharacterized protein n=1 Tax=Russula ochroleuca TaxID=152965 RepID=A0A9P5JUK6_9AGAM|nr:hypothetical protein DFH94DRAFT_123763 [Russula ochroleuca]KAF8471435.1 hypothetical protein DFH94DRAFT_202288 [Russula ochroleuca]